MTAFPVGRKALGPFAELGIAALIEDTWTFLFQGYEITSTVAVVTPEMAADWLERLNNRTEAPNRSLSAVSTRGYVTQMRRGAWRVSPQSIIAFDEEGFLLDGQHRLSAIVALGEAITFRVEIGWPRESFAVLDSGNKRQASQLLGGKYASTRGAAARLLTGATDTASSREGDLTSRPLNSEELLAWVAAWPELDLHAEACTRVYQGTRINASIHLAVVCQAARTKHAPLLDKWMTGLLVGAELEPTDPRLHLRNRWIRDYRALSGSSSNRNLPYLTVVKAWNAFASGVPMLTLKASATEKIPSVVGFKR